MTATTAWTKTALAGLQEALDLLTTDGMVPGGVIAHGTYDSEPGYLASGVVAPECGEARPGPDTVYDVASLTKVLATWPLIGTTGLDLDAPVRSLLHRLPAEAPGGQVTARQILSHTTGLRADTRLDQYRGTSTNLAELICQEELIAVPGAGHRYINRGFILAGLLLAQITGRGLDELSADLWQGLGMTGTTYGPVARAAHVAPTEQRLPGAPRLWGLPHDDNAALLGGVAGHAGVFSTPADLAAYATALLHGNADGSPMGRWLTESMVPQAAIEPGLDRGLAWILADEGRVAYHHGFTGTSLYLHPPTGRYLAICTNAVYHHQDNRTRLAPLRALALKTLTDEP
ncbi:CubicO group peptidase (beta-lactamase class C family) [Kitasatospora sp. MAA4]|uniref:serine hydrolase domain-containing protein n=1 Tax=Kitasatospora sp. MAA4 TaxID=3035093 RepID=UPI002476787F|nr:serine hydrolase domain-containing protein [Kitasatospora sp. MAA4]MDH6132730.1 CubicO group peptidase (beta-lactamase class C family) [Kitasatospora sp. MAA4]